MYSEHKKQHLRYPSAKGFMQGEENCSDTEKDETLKNYYFASEEKIKQEKVALLKIKIDELQLMLFQTNQENQSLLSLNKKLTETLKGVNEDIQQIFAVKIDEDQQLTMQNKPVQILERIKHLQEKMEVQQNNQNGPDSTRFRGHNHCRDKVSLLSYRNSCEQIMQKEENDYRMERKGYPTIKIPNQRKSSIDYVKNNEIKTKKILTYTNTPIIPDYLSIATNLTKQKRGNYNQSDSLNMKVSDRNNSNNYQQLYNQLSPKNKNGIISDQLSPHSKMRIAGSTNIIPNISYRQKQSPRSPRNYPSNLNHEKKLMHNKSSGYIMKQSIQQIWLKAQSNLHKQKSYEKIDSYFNDNPYRVQRQKSPRRLNELSKSIEQNQFTRKFIRNEDSKNLDNQVKSYLNLQQQSKINLNSENCFSNRSYLDLKLKSPRNLNHASSFMKSKKKLYF